VRRAGAQAGGELGEGPVELGRLPGDGLGRLAELSLHAKI
jgi:hypothetical protein